MRPLHWIGFVSLGLIACSSSAPEEESGQSEDALIADSCPTTPANPSWITTETMTFDGGNSKIRVGTMGRGDKGDVLYLHGFADRFDNHQPLFEELTRQGLRVITFDYPSHGESCGTSINWFGFAELADLAGRIETAKRGRGPLYLAGWSTGGLLAVRMAQGVGSSLSRPIAGMALFAPGVDVRTVLSVSESTLTRNRSAPHAGPPSPSSPAFRPLFATALLTNSFAASAQLSANIPTLVITGGQTEDEYVDTAGVEAWTTSQRNGGAEMFGLSCAGGYHELDNEPEPMGGAVREAAARFLAGDRQLADAGGCAAY